MSLSSLKLHQAIRKELHHANIFISDADYSIPSSNWIQGKFYSLYRNWLKKHGAYVWRSYHDCDNKAGIFQSFANLCHLKTMEAHDREGRETTQGIAVGAIWYGIEGKKERGHAINILYTERGIKFMEPQNGTWLPLTKKEKDSAWLVVI